MDKEEFNRMKEILKKHNMRLQIWACGCCSSPTIVFEYEGDEIVSADGYNFDMFKDEE